MVNTEMLNECIKAAGFTLSGFNEEVGISRAAFYLKKINRREFTASEIKRICEKLKLDIYQKDSIFFAADVA